METQNVPFLVILSERSESKDLRIVDTAKILRLPLVAQDDRLGDLSLFAKTPCKNENLCRREGQDPPLQILTQCDPLCRAGVTPAGKTMHELSAATRRKRAGPEGPALKVWFIAAETIPNGYGK